MRRIGHYSPLAMSAMRPKLAIRMMAFSLYCRGIGAASVPLVRDRGRMMCDICVDAILAYETMADAVWLLWANSVISDELALMLWVTITN